MFALVDEGPAGAFDIHSNLSKRSSFVYFMVSLLFTSGLFLSRDVFLVPSIIHHLCKKYPLRVQFKLTTALTTAAGSLILEKLKCFDRKFSEGVHLPFRGGKRFLGGSLAKGGSHFFCHFFKFRIIYLSDFCVRK